MGAPGEVPEIALPEPPEGYDPAWFAAVGEVVSNAIVDLSVLVGYAVEPPTFPPMPAEGEPGAINRFRREVERELSGLAARLGIEPERAAKITRLPAYPDGGLG